MIKTIEIFELHTSDPLNRKRIVPLKFLIIMHNYENVWTINRSKSLPGFG